ncbi:MAG: Fic family protein [Candidatus Methanomethylophilaceae archaeon]|nr:Fic family protein [Candidatus Methanomethylophilaceae archaeon]
MRTFDYSFLKGLTVNMDLLNTVSMIETLKERDSNRILRFPATYRDMESAAMVQSVFGSNAIEGIFTSDDRLKDICMRKVEPKGHDESEIAGYRDALDLIHREYESLDIDLATIRQLHRITLSYTKDGGGEWKDVDNIIGRRNPDGSISVTFRPMSADETPEAMEQLVLAYRLAIQDSGINRLLLIPCFIQDFLSIHPFLDGNGRTSRLLSLLLLYKEGYDVGKYVSFENMTYRNRPEYYRSLSMSSKGWIDGMNDYMPFIRNFLGILLLCYKELDRRFATAVGVKTNKTSRIEYAVMNSLLPISKRELCENLPDISEVMVANVLRRLLREGMIEKVGSGPATRYRRAGDRPDHP